VVCFPDSDPWNHAGFVYYHSGGDTARSVPAHYTHHFPFARMNCDSKKTTRREGPCRQALFAILRYR
jgi:hypothetical protein